MNEIELEIFRKFIDVVEKATIQHEVEQAKAGGRMELIGSFYNKEKHEESRYENHHSEVLAYLLNPHHKAGHKHGSEYLKLFLKQIRIPDSIIEQVGDGSGISVSREAYTNDGRIDILIETKDSKGNGIFAIAIENKIWAGDQPSQLDRYASYLSTWYTEINQNLFIVYLTPYGWEASDDSKGNLKPEQIINISYEKDILTWLSQLPTKQNENLIRSAIEQYIYTVQKVIGKTPEEMSLMSELQTKLLNEVKERNIDLKHLRNLQSVMSDLFLERIFGDIKIGLEQKLVGNSHEEIKYILNNYANICLPILDRKTYIQATMAIDSEMTEVWCGIGSSNKRIKEELPFIEKTESDGYWYYAKGFDLKDTDDIVKHMTDLYKKYDEYMKANKS